MKLSNILLASSLFYFRIPREKWAKRMKLLKTAGYNTIDVYFPGTIMKQLREYGISQETVMYMLFWNWQNAWAFCDCTARPIYLLGMGWRRTSRMAGCRRRFCETGR